MGDEFGLFDQQIDSYGNISEGAPAIDPRTGLETHITGPVVTDEQREAGTRANARRAAAIREILAPAEQGERPSADGWAAAVARIAEERGLPLIPLSKLGIEIDEDGFDSTSFLEALTPGAEAIPYLDREHGVVYKLFDLRIDRGEDYIGKKLIARRDEDGWDVTQTGATLFESIEKLAVIHAAGALPTEIVGMGAQDAFGYLIVKQPAATAIEVNPGIRAQAVSAIGGQLVSSRAELGGELRVFWHDGKPWFLGDLHPGNLMADSEGRPTIIDALVGGIPDAMVRDLPDVAEAIEQARRKQESEDSDEGQGELFD